MHKKGFCCSCLAVRIQRCGKVAVRGLEQIKGRLSEVSAIAACDATPQQRHDQRLHGELLPSFLAVAPQGRNKLFQQRISRVRAPEAEVLPQRQSRTRLEVFGVVPGA